LATKPTRTEERAADRLAEALGLVAEARRLDSRSPLDLAGFRDLAARLASVSSAFDTDTIVARALDQRCRALGLRADAPELLTLLDSSPEPLETLLLGDDEARGLVERLEQELGDL
jgi:hypothetical protein